MADERDDGAVLVSEAELLGILDAVIVMARVMARRDPSIGADLKDAWRAWAETKWTEGMRSRGDFPRMAADTLDILMRADGNNAEVIDLAEVTRPESDDDEPDDPPPAA